ncbi:MAG: Methyl-accepting chemotaxis protein [Pseudomonadota bacterium]|jgi:methyl-accepting chemotaxis protein
MNLQKYSIGSRLSFGFFVIVLCLLIISVVGYVQLVHTNDDTDIIVKDRLVKVNLAQTIENEINRQSRALRTALLAQDEQVIAQELKKIESSKPIVQQSLQKLSESVQTAEGKAGLGRIANARQVFIQHEDHLLQLIKNGRYETARNYLLTSMIAAQTEYLSSVEEFSAMQRRMIDAFALDANLSAEKGERTILWMAIFSVLASILISVVTTRSIVDPLKRLQQGMKQVERTSDFSQRIQVSGADEVGQASSSFNDMLMVQQNALTQVNQAVGAMAAGQFETTVTADLRGDLNITKDAINQSIESMKMTMAAINHAMDALSQGRFDVQVNAEVSGEFRTTLNQADQAIRMLHSMLGDVGKTMANVAKGDLNGRVMANGQGDLEDLKSNINSSLSTLGQAIRSIGQNAQLVASASGETTTAVDQLSDNAATQKSAISQVALALKHTTESVADVSRNTAIASDNSQRAMVALQEGMQKMADMVEVVDRIAANSKKISGISSVIEKIAEKTNMLSINAAVEAAHAGENGKGFGVVADEVGALATSSASSSKEITELVRQASEEARLAVITVQEVSKEMQVIQSDASATHQTLQRIAAALEEQSSAIEEISMNVNSLERIAHSNASAAEEMAQTAGELNKIAAETRQEIANFRT